MQHVSPLRCPVSSYKRYEHYEKYEDRWDKLKESGGLKRWGSCKSSLQQRHKCCFICDVTVREGCFSGLAPLSLTKLL